LPNKIYPNLLNTATIQNVCEIIDSNSSSSTSSSPNKQHKNPNSNHNANDGSIILASPSGVMSGSAQIRTSSPELLESAGSHFAYGGNIAYEG
jgi:hypothetical protein